MKIYIHTLGCKVNQYESQALETVFSGRGHEICRSAEDCDAVIINTCAVTAESVRKSRQAIRKIMSEAPGAVTAVCGCWPQTEPEKARAIGADVLFGSGDRLGLADAVENAYLTRQKFENIDRVMARRVFEELPAGSPGDRTRALMKIEDGCVNFCTYCVIPYARGPIRSLSPDAVRAEAHRLMDEGYREIVITGIEIASYGRDLPGKPTLADAVTAVCEAAPSCRVRLGSLEPRCITEELCIRLSALGNVCPHFHLSLQSGCDETLSRMNRKYGTERFYQSVELLRKYFPGCGITADLITGFPGETEEEFSKTLTFIEKCGFSAMHIFPYSIRGGTPAASMPDQVPKGEKHARAKRASAVAERMREKFLKNQVGTVKSVLFEQEEAPGIWSGHTENYVLVSVRGDNLKNTLAKVRITGTDGGSLLGVIIL